MIIDDYVCNEHFLRSTFSEAEILIGFQIGFSGPPLLAMKLASLGIFRVNLRSSVPCSRARSRAHSRDPKVEKIINGMKNSDELQRQKICYTVDRGFDILNI